MVSSGWKVLGVVPGKPRNGRTIAIQVSESGGRFSFGVGFVQADGSFKPTAFLQDRDI